MITNLLPTKYDSIEDQMPARLWLWPNILSLDAPLVAVLWQVLLAKTLPVPLNPAEPVMLALSIWLLYAADHILDVLRPRSGTWEPIRKQFYRRHARCATAVTLSAAAVIFPLAWRVLKTSTLYDGLLLGAVVAIYFAGIHLVPPSWRAKWPREAVIAVLFTLGTFLAVWSACPDKRLLLVPALLFAVLCWANCCAIETWEWERSGYSQDAAPSRSTYWTGNHLSVVGIAVALAAAAAMTAGSLIAPAFAQAAMLSGFALFALGISNARFSADVLRVAADLALCTPLPIVVMLLLQ